MRTWRRSSATPPRSRSRISSMRRAAAIRARPCASCSAWRRRAPTGPRRCRRSARHFTQLHRVAATQASGGSLEQAMKSLKPRPHFKREPVFMAHCRRWGANRLAHALPLIQETVRRSRRSPDLDSRVRRAAAAEARIGDLTERTGVLMHDRQHRGDPWTRTPQTHERRNKLFMLLRERAFKRGPGRARLGQERATTIST